MESYNIALFGEAEKGEYRTTYFCKSLVQLVDNLGNPPPESKGLYYAVQVLLFQYNLIFIRVREEGFSVQDYFSGLKLLRNQNLIPEIAAICIPGVGSSEIIDATLPLCAVHHSIIITTEADLYDYLAIQA